MSKNSTEYIPAAWVQDCSGYTPAYLVEWVDSRGQLVRLQTSSEFPMTTITNLEQRMAAKVLGRDFQDAHDRLIEMVRQLDPALADQLQKGHFVVESPAK